MTTVLEAAMWLQNLGRGVSLHMHTTPTSDVVVELHLRSERMLSATGRDADEAFELARKRVAKLDAYGLIAFVHDNGDLWHVPLYSDGSVCEECWEVTDIVDWSPADGPMEPGQHFLRDVNAALGTSYADKDIAGKRL